MRVSLGSSMKTHASSLNPRRLSSDLLLLLLHPRNRAIELVEHLGPHLVAHALVVGDIRPRFADRLERSARCPGAPQIAIRTIWRCLPAPASASALAPSPGAQSLPSNIMAWASAMAGPMRRITILLRPSPSPIQPVELVVEHFQVVQIPASWCAFRPASPRARLVDLVIAAQDDGLAVALDQPLELCAVLVETVALCALGVIVDHDDVLDDLGRLRRFGRVGAFGAAGARGAVGQPRARPAHPDPHRPPSRSAAARARLRPPATSGRRGGGAGKCRSWSGSSNGGLSICRRAPDRPSAQRAQRAKAVSRRLQSPAITRA